MPLNSCSRSTDTLAKGEAPLFCHTCFFSGLLLLWAEQAGKQPSGWPLVMDISWMEIELPCF